MEDDLVSETYITRVVKIFSKEILVVRNGVEGVKTCHDNPDLDLILMDIKLPKMGGYEATRQIWEFNKDVIIIAQTAYALISDREKAIEAGCNDYISKPISKVLLKELVKMHFC